MKTAVSIAVDLQVSPESLSPAKTTNLLTPSVSGRDTRVLVWAILDWWRQVLQ